MRPIARAHGLSLLQLACEWDLAHDAVACVAPTLIQESGEGARPIEDKRAELAALPLTNPRAPRRSPAIRELGDNVGCMALKGAVPDHAGEDLADRWRLREEHLEVATRWAIEPERDLVARRRRPPPRSPAAHAQAPPPRGPGCRPRRAASHALGGVPGLGHRREDRLGVLRAPR